MHMRPMFGLVLLGVLAACGSDDGAAGPLPPLIQSLALGEQGEGHFRLAAAVTAPDSGVLRPQWEATKGSLSAVNELQTEWVLPPQAGAYPIRLTVQDAQGGVAQALIVMLYDPSGRSEVTPATFASFRRGQLQSSQTQLIPLHRGQTPLGSPPPAQASAGGLSLGQLAVTPLAEGGLMFKGVLPTGLTPTAPLAATWSALDGVFEQAQGLQATWRPAQPVGLAAVTLAVADGQGNQGQAVIRMVLEQGLPRENHIDLVNVRNGRLGRQTFVALPTPAPFGPVPQPSSSPVAAPSSSTSPAPSASGSTASATPTPASPLPSTSGSPYATMPPSGQPTSTPTPTGPTPSPSFTPYNPLATPTPTASPTASPSP